MVTEHFPVRLSLRIDWSEMDLFGHVNNVAFLKYVQAARVNFWEHTSIQNELGINGKGPILASVSCQFKKPLHYPGDVIIQSRVAFIKTTSFGFHHRIIDTHGEIAAEAHDVIVMYDFNSKEKLPLSETLRQELTQAKTN